MQAIRTAREQALSLALFALLPLAAVSTEGQLQAQARTKFVVHYYADSIYGDDAQAAALNPTRTRMLAPHGTGPNQIVGLLQHAPYSFQTVTAALVHIRAQYPQLPYTIAKNRIVQGVVIHCAPGLYGPTTYDPPKKGSSWNIDPLSGLPWNGETFPIDLPHGVSIQGTSALDTIFDGRGDEGFVNHIFTVSKPPLAGIPRNEGSHRKSFIAHITIRGATSTADSGAPNGAGIFIDGIWGPVDLLIHNCFIVENTVGIAMTYSNSEESAPSSPVIINNTIAWNSIGIWSGSAPFSPSTTHVGFSEPRVLNNIIDPFHPAGGGGNSAFEGVHWHDLEVNTGTGVNGWNTINAWEGPAIPVTRPYGWANLGATATGWPATGLRAPLISSSPTGRIEGLVDITPMTFGRTTQSRGTLFINDLFRNFGGSDLSPHDFRLSVYTPLNTSIGTLVDQGASPGSFAGGVIFRNGQAITYGNGWGLTTGTGDAYDLEKAQMNVGAWDAEGFGNIRSYLRRNWTPGPFSNIDLGADDLGDLIMAPYIFRTRIFSMNVPNAPGVSNHTQINFVDTPNLTGTTALRPLSNAWVGQSWSLPLPNGIDNSWWKQAQANPNPPPGSLTSNYTDGVLQSVRRTTLDPYRPSFMRNLQCDFAPHLLLNINPMWPTQLENTFPGYPAPNPIGIYACNPWFDGSTIPNYPATLFPDNPFLYYNLGGGGYPINVPTYVQAGILNSPGSYLGLTGGPLNRAFLEPSLLQSQFGPFGGGPPRNYYQTNAVGLGDSLGVDTILNTGDLGMRVNCQVKYETDVWSNLQTFLEIYVNPTSAKSKAAAGKVPRPTKKEQEDMLKKILKRYNR